MKKKTKKGIYIYIESMIYFVKRQSFAVQTGYYSYENISLPNYFVKKNKIKNSREVWFIPPDHLLVLMSRLDPPFIKKR